LLCFAILASPGCRKSEEEATAGEETTAGEEATVSRQPTAKATPSPKTPSKSSSKVQVVKLESPGSKSGEDSRTGLPKRWLGITVANMKEPIPGAPEDCRTQVQRAMRGSPAHEAGLRRGDVIMAAQGQPVKRFQEYLAQARKVEIGERLKLQMLREGQPFEAELEMLAKPKDMRGWRRRAFPGTEAFAFSLPSLRPANAGSSHHNLGGKPQLLYFWATWCAPCRQIAPQVEQLYKKAGDALTIVAVSSEEETVIRRYLKSSDTTYPVAHDLHGMLKQDYEVSKLPTAVLVGGNGRVILWDYGLGGVRKVLRTAREQLEL